VALWRRSYDVPPPPLELDDERHPRHDPRYRHLAPDVLPGSESLQQVVQRTLPYWHDVIVPELLNGKRPLVVIHGNSIRALIKHLDGVSDGEIASVEIPTGIPLVYQLDKELKPISRRYLGDPEVARRAAEAVANQSKRS
jgi:2,3-bisphosphoglycerate-dependent phosphoglycerate mutase